MIIIDRVKSTESTAKFLEAKQASTTIGFGWDEADHKDDMQHCCKVIQCSKYQAIPVPFTELGSCE